MTDQDVIAAIRRHHLKANIQHYAPETLHWDLAYVDKGGTIFGMGPYVKLPVDWDGERVMIRVYPPARLQRQLAKKWKPTKP